MLQHDTMGATVMAPAAKIPNVIKPGNCTKQRAEGSIDIEGGNAAIVSGWGYWNWQMENCIDSGHVIRGMALCSVICGQFEYR